MRDPREPLTTDGYQRPQQVWQCGLADEGPPCPLGPDAGGHCPAAAACRPQRDGERWHCNRSPLRGGPCSDGPGPDGACPIVYRCTPVRSLRTRRGRFVLGVAIAAMGAACMALSGPWRNEMIAPGPLSVHHAQLVNGRDASLRCAQCHAAGGQTLRQWWETSIGDAIAGPTQSQQCTVCHEQVVGGEFALAAHNMPLETLAATTAQDARTSWPDRLRDPREPVACSACHREHQGPHHDLTAISDKACQACHQTQYSSFAEDHPDFEAWPYQRRTRIVFDHASHQAKHFPAEKHTFDCAACHQADATGQRQLTGSYAATCAECHDKSLTASLAEGVALVSLPTIDVEALADAGKKVEPWPETANGDFEGAPAMPAALLLAADKQAAAAAEVLGPRLDLYDVDPEDAKQLKAAGDVADATRGLVSDLAAQGPAALAQRIGLLLGRELSPQELAALSAGLSSDVASGYSKQWFGAAPPEPKAERAAAAAGAWNRDDATLSLRYHPTGHADPWMRAWLDVLAEAATGPHAVVAEPLLRAAMAPTAPGQCGSCHSVDRNADGRLAIQWQPLNVSASPRGLTKFSHGPHVIQPATSDCTTCHRIKTAADTAASYAHHDPGRFAAGFEPMTKADCAACHTPRGASDGCATCHNYHVRPSAPAVGK